MISTRQEIGDLDKVDIIRAYWTHGVGTRLGIQPWVLLCYLAFGNKPVTQSTNDIAKNIGVRWYTLKEILVALEESGFVKVTKTPRGPKIVITEPPWLHDPPENPNP